LRGVFEEIFQWFEKLPGALASFGKEKIAEHTESRLKSPLYRNGCKVLGLGAMEKSLLEI
jgi:hypothetical protein